MHKTTLLLTLLFLVSALAAQSTLIIDQTNIPIKIKDAQIHLKKGKSNGLSIPVHSKADTVVTFNPETFVELIEIVYSGQVTGQTTLQTIDSKKVLSRSTFLENPMIYVSHAKVDYVPYRLFVYYFDKGEYRGIGFYDTATLQYFKDYDESIAPQFNTLLRYFNNTTLQDFKGELDRKLSSDVTEIYITEAAFVSSKTEEKLMLTKPIKLTLK